MELARILIMLRQSFASYARGLRGRASGTRSIRWFDPRSWGPAVDGQAPRVLAGRHRQSSWSPAVRKLERLPVNDPLIVLPKPFTYCRVSNEDNRRRLYALPETRVLFTRGKWPRKTEKVRSLPKKPASQPPIAATLGLDDRWVLDSKWCRHSRSQFRLRGANGGFVPWTSVKGDIDGWPGARAPVRLEEGPVAWEIKGILNGR